MAEWIEYLDALPAEKRAASVPKAELLSLEASEDGWALRFMRGEEEVVVKQGEHVEFRSREENGSQDWQKWPVLGVSYPQAEAYVAWLGGHGPLSGARLCSEWEWERAARGADSRLYPDGDVLERTRANFDKTYGVPDTIGPNEVGTSGSISPFGVQDLAGNAAEWTTSSMSEGESVLRGGAFFFDSIIALAYNRAVVPSQYHDWQTGVRVCASFDVR